MPFSEELRYYWFTPMRTGSRSCSKISEFFNFKFHGHSMKISESHENFSVILNVRHPYTRLVSLYNQACFNFGWKNNNFEEWLIRNLNSEIDYHQIFIEQLIKKNIPQKINHFVKLENLENDLLKIPFISREKENLEKIFNEHIRKNLYENMLEKVGQVEMNPWMSFYNRKLLDLVYDKLRLQFEIFNYNKNYFEDGTP